MDADVDCIFDTPIELAQSIAAYRHDIDLAGEDEEPFEILRQQSSAPHKAES